MSYLLSIPTSILRKMLSLSLKKKSLVVKWSGLLRVMKGYKSLAQFGSITWIGIFIVKTTPGTSADANYNFDVFISYSHKNTAFVDRLVEDLKDHHISVWVDRLEIEVGDPFRQKIEKAIDSCRYFCLVISQASMESYYIRQLELEAAFTKMARSGRETFILPLLRQKPKEALPLMLSSRHYLDCSTPKKYSNNLRKLVKKIKLTDEFFTGERLYKNVDTSFSGQMVGVGPLEEVSYRGSCVRVFFDNGVITTMETITDGKEDGVKSVIYDSQRRVYEIILFRDNRVVDSWRYIYDSDTGKRSKKLIIKPGQKPHLELIYDNQGKLIAENPL